MNRNYLKPEARLKLYEWLLVNREELAPLTDREIAIKATAALSFRVTHSNINSLRCTMRKMNRISQATQPQAGKSQHLTRAIMMGLLQVMREIGVQPSGEMIAFYERTKGRKAPAWMSGGAA